jgi:transposase
MDRVVVGMDPHKASLTIEARDTREVLRARGRFDTDKRNFGGVRQLSRGVRGGDH